MRQERHRCVRFVLLVACFAIGPGCSLVMVDGPPPNHEGMAAFECTESDVLPALDAVQAVSSVSLAIWASTLENPPDDDMVLGLLASAMAWGYSAGQGVNRTADCRRARMQWVVRESVEAEYLREDALARRVAEDLPAVDDEADRVVAIEIQPERDTIAEGEIALLRPTAYGGAGQRLLGVSFEWSSSDSTVAVPIDQAMVEGVGAGRAIIRAESGEATGAMEVIVVSDSVPGG